MGIKFSHRNLDKHKYSKPSNNFDNFLPSSLYAYVPLGTAHGYSDP